ncbi:MAG: UDP-forming cellulose synthase catalytic subunit [Pseudomonadota bacterium]
MKRAKTQGTTMLLQKCLWLVLALLMCAIAAQPVGLQSQAMLGVVGLTAMFCIYLLKLGGTFRLIMVSIGGLLIFRYIWWRATSTLPPTDELANFIPGVMLLAAEIYSVSMLAINLFIVSDPIDRKAAPLPKDKGQWPSIDVYVPTYNEPTDLLSATLAAAANMEYPDDKIEIYLLDDGGTHEKRTASDPRARAAALARHEELKALCADFGVQYLTRAENKSAKAGNLNAAFPRTKGDLILVLDADHAPVQDFLLQTAGFFFQNDRLFLVQTPHSFVNPDPLERNLDTFERMPAENEMFYSMVQRGLDKWNASFFCGSAALLSRKALASVGGFSGKSITEDCETALNLHAKGWESVYLDQPLIAGLQPETFASFIGQRTRWCQGMLQIFLFERPLLKRGLTLGQRIGYTSSGLFWLFPFARLTFMLAPVLYILFGLQIFEANLQEFLAFTTVFMAANVILQNHLYGTLRWPWISEIYEYIQSIHLLGAIGSVLLRPGAPSFKVTDKGLSVEREHLSNLAWPFIAFFGLIAVTTGFAFWRLFTGGPVDELLAVVAVWATFNLVIAGVALGVVVERPELRSGYRLPSERPALVRLGDTKAKAHIEDCGLGGLSIRVPQVGEISLPEKGDLIPVAFAMHRAGTQAASLQLRLTHVDCSAKGLTLAGSFEQLSAADYRAMADLMYPTAARFNAMRNARRAGRSITFGSALVFRWFIIHPLRALRAILQWRPSEKAVEPTFLRPQAGPSRADFSTHDFNALVAELHNG